MSHIDGMWDRREVLEIPTRICIIGTGYKRLQTGVQVPFLCLLQYGIIHYHSACSSEIISAEFTTIYPPLLFLFRTAVGEET